MAKPTTQPSGWVGWVYFAGILLLVRAFFEAFLGIVSLTRSSFYVVTESHLAVFNFTAWGWGQLVLAMILLFAGFSVLSGHMFGRVVAVIVTTLSMLTSMAFIPAYPVWSLAAIAIDVLVLYALIVHGGELREDS
ncbi:MAG: hypothetical protein QG553_289 [Patescibacteria group bacterium]|nr:hypothetical protein [Patescibacteria group bacterium]